MRPNTTPRKPPEKEAIWKHWREVFPTNHADVCMACDADLFPTERAHIHARFDGGEDDIENFVLLCHTCHKHQEFVSSVLIATGRPADMGDLKGMLGMIADPGVMNVFRYFRNGDLRPVTNSRLVSLEGPEAYG